MDNVETRKGFHVPHSNKKEIIKVTIILTVLTAMEFVVTVTMPETLSDWKAAVFLILTFAKAFYIVAFFMHLKHEKIHLAYTIIIPFIFVIYLVILLIYEGAFL